MTEWMESMCFGWKTGVSNALDAGGTQQRNQMISGLWLEQCGRCDAVGVWGCGRCGKLGRSGVQEIRVQFERVKFKMPIRQPSGDAKKAAGR